MPLTAAALPASRHGQLGAGRARRPGLPSTIGCREVHSSSGFPVTQKVQRAPSASSLVYTACHGGFCPVGGRPPVSNNSATVFYFPQLIFSKSRESVPGFSAAGRQQVNGCPSVRLETSAQLHVCRSRQSHRDTPTMKHRSTQECHLWPPKMLQPLKNIHQITNT